MPFVTSWFNSSIQFGGDHVDAPEHRDHVADHVALDHLGEALVVDEGAGAGADAPGDVFAGADYLVTQFAVAGFDAAVDFALGGFEAAVGHDELEVLDETFD